MVKGNLGRGRARCVLLRAASREAWREAHAIASLARAVHVRGARFTPALLALAPCLCYLLLVVQQLGFAYLARVVHVRGACFTLTPLALASC